MELVRAAKTELVRGRPMVKPRGVARERPMETERARLRPTAIHSGQNFHWERGILEPPCCREASVKFEHTQMLEDIFNQ
jgi:hypothetical protein